MKPHSAFFRFVANAMLFAGSIDHILTAYGIAHTFETYEGTHISGIQDRVEKKVVPFFSSNLSFGRAGR